jgi:Predicted permeases
MKCVPVVVNLDPTVLKLSNIDPDEMTIFQLYRYIQLQARHHQDVSRVQLVFWQRCFQPLSTMVMMMLAIPFVFGSLRSSMIGVKLLLGTCCGFAFYTLNHFLAA